MSDSTSFRVTLRQMADAEDAADRRRLHDMLASQIEVAFNNQANQTQVVLWDVQEDTRSKINDLHEHQADTNLLLTTVADNLSQLHGIMQQVLRATKENTREIEKLNKRMNVSEADRADLRRLYTELRERFDGYAAAAPIAERDRLVAQIEEHQRRLDALEDRDAASREP